MNIHVVILAILLIKSNGILRDFAFKLEGINVKSIGIYIQSKILHFLASTSVGSFLILHNRIQKALLLCHFK